MKLTTTSTLWLYGAWIVSIIATGGSLYFSQVQGFVPCDLCWYQRIAMYPLSIVLGIAAYHSDHGIRKYGLPLAIVGGSISLYHYGIQKFPQWAPPTPCTSGVPCNIQYINWGGFITIPFLALSAFGLIILFLILAHKQESSFHV